MQVGAVSLKPYIYNTNAVSSRSMNKISAIGDDVLKSKTDVTGLMSKEAKAASSEVLNPLKRGESADFAGIVQMQMQLSRMNADRLIKPAETTQEDVTQKVTNVSSQYENAMQGTTGSLGFDFAV